MTIANYEKKFIELSRFTMFIIADERDKCMRFEYGLQEEIQTVVTSVVYIEFGKLAKAALKVKCSLGRLHQYGSSNKRGNQSWLASGTSDRPPKRGSNSFGNSNFSQ